MVAHGVESATPAQVVATFAKTAVTLSAPDEMEAGEKNCTSGVPAVPQVALSEAPTPSEPINWTRPGPSAPWCSSSTAGSAADWATPREMSAGRRRGGPDVT